MCLVTSQVSAIEIVTHYQVSDRNLTKSQLRRIYTMRQLRWSDNVAITVFVLPTQHDLHQRFAKEHLQIFPYQLNRIWHKLTYSGLGVAPTIVKTEQELFQAVINTPGAIGYINTDTLKEIQQNKLTTVNEDYANTTMEDKQKISIKGVLNVVKIKD
jgi:ABC-type phosphate transport system substrate-binding protein